MSILQRQRRSSCRPLKPIRGGSHTRSRIRTWRTARGGSTWSDRDGRTICTWMNSPNWMQNPSEIRENLARDHVRNSSAPCLVVIHVFPEVPFGVFVPHLVNLRLFSCAAVSAALGGNSPLHVTHINKNAWTHGRANVNFLKKFISCLRRTTGID